MLNPKTVDDALAEMGKNRLCYKNLSSRRCMQLRLDYSGFSAGAFIGAPDAGPAAGWH
jgi:hypothetical protein